MNIIGFYRWKRRSILYLWASTVVLLENYTFGNLRFGHFEKRIYTPGKLRDIFRFPIALFAFLNFWANYFFESFTLKNIRIDNETFLVLISFLVTNCEKTLKLQLSYTIPNLVLRGLQGWSHLIQKWSALTYAASLPLRCCTLTENQSTALTQLWSALKKSKFQSSKISAKQHWFLLEQRCFVADFVRKSSEQRCLPGFKLIFFSSINKFPIEIFRSTLISNRRVLIFSPNGEEKKVTKFSC